MDKDISRLAMERAASTLVRTKKVVRETIPYGPSKVRLTPSELRKALQNARPDAIQQLMKYLGPEQAMQLLLGTPRTPPTLGQFMEERNASS